MIHLKHGAEDAWPFQDERFLVSKWPFWFTAAWEKVAIPLLSLYWRELVQNMWILTSYNPHEICSNYMKAASFLHCCHFSNSAMYRLNIIISFLWIVATFSLCTTFLEIWIFLVTSCRASCKILLYFLFLSQFFFRILRWLHWYPFKVKKESIRLFRVSLLVETKAPFYIYSI